MQMCVHDIYKEKHLFNFHWLLFKNQLLSRMGGENGKNIQNFIFLIKELHSDWCSQKVEIQEDEIPSRISG